MFSDENEDDFLEAEVVKPKADQFAELCDVFEYNPEEFKNPPQVPSKMTRFEEDGIDTGFEHQRSNQINQMGLGPRILELKRTGHSLSDIAERLSLPPHQVRQWWETFQGLAPKQKQVFAKVMNENSVFNIRARMEESFQELQLMASSVKDNPELWVVYSGQVMNYLKFAKDLVQSLNLDQQREEEQNVILEEIRLIDPKTAMRIVKRIQELRSAKKAIGG